MRALRSAFTNRPSPGMTNTPFFFVSFTAVSASRSRNAADCLLVSSSFSASVRTSAVLVKLLPYLFPSFLCYFMGPWSRCFRIPEKPCPSPFRKSDARTNQPIFRKPSVYAGKNEPTAVYDAALSGVCQSKNRDLFCFWLVFPRFLPISWVLCGFRKLLWEKANKLFVVSPKSVLATFLRPQQF